MPIPLHYTRRLYRHFNQSAEIARTLAFASKSGSQLDVTSLYSAKPTRPLARHSKAKRQDMLCHAFALRERAKQLIHKRPILLIDDVYTTGTTSELAARCLHKAGATD